MKGRALAPVENSLPLQFPFIIICVEMLLSQMSLFPKLVGSNCLFSLQPQVLGRSFHNPTTGFCFYDPFSDLGQINTDFFSLSQDVLKLCIKRK